MLEHVALNQTGFKVPGVAPDARGVLLGKQGAVLLPSLDRLVAFLRLLSQESTLDDVIPALSIWEVRSRLGAREYLLLLPAHNSYLLDRCARAVQLAGGLLFTGSGKHYVKYRDRASPLGYDAAALSIEVADFLLYSEAATAPYTRVREIALSRLVFDLSLRPLPGGARGDIDELLREGEPVLWLTARRGVARRLCGYLWRNRVRFSAALVPEGEVVPAQAAVTAWAQDRPPPRPPSGGAGRAHPSGPAGSAPAGAGAPLPGRGARFTPSPEYLLVRVEDLPERMLRLFSGLPGVTLFRPLLDNCLVEVGYRHPLRLTSLEALFDKERFYLFSAGATSRPCDMLVARPPLLPGESLIGARFELADDLALDLPLRQPVPADEQQIALRLCKSAGAGGLPRATLLSWARVSWLKRLVYALPPTLLRGYRAAPIADVGILIVAERDVDVLPIGTPLSEAAPGVFVPLGLEVLPRIGPDVLGDHLGGTTGKYVILLPAEGGVRALSVAQSALDPLGRRLLAPVQVGAAQRDPALPSPPPPAEASQVNLPAGALPLWGLPAEGPAR